MPVPLIRRDADAPVKDADATRDWLMDRVRQDVKLKGQPHPKIHLLGHGFEETVDLDAMAKKDRGADVGATFQALRARPNVVRRFVVMTMMLGGDDETERAFALLFEEVDAFDGRRWWMARLEYTQDPATGVGRPAAAWEAPPGEANNPAQLPPFLRELASPPAGAKPAHVIPPGGTWEPDIQFAFGDLAAHVPTLAAAKQMVELTAGLAVKELLTGVTKGSVVVRLAGRSWEQFVLSGDMPGSLEEMVRYIANNRLPPADAVGLAQIAIRPQDDPPVLGMQVIAEFGGKFCETWAPIACPEGPQGPKVITSIQWWDDRPVPSDGMWLGVESSVELMDPSAEA